jgi:predicted aspartyl protease
VSVFPVRKTVLFCRRVGIPKRAFLGSNAWWALAAGVVLVAGGPFGATSQAAGRQEQAYQFEELPLLRSRQNHLILRAYINGRPAMLTVDTGAPVSAIALNRRRHFRLSGIPGGSPLAPRLQINGVFNSVAIAHSLRLGALELVDEPVVVVDLASSSRAARMLHEQEVDGIIGADILFPTKAVLDCKKQTLILKMDPSARGRTPGVSYRGFRKMPIRVGEGNLYVDGAVNGSPARLMIDTGAFATLLHHEYVRRMRIPLHNTRYSSAAVNLSQRRIQVARIRRLSVGSVNIVGREFGVVDLEGLIHSDLLRGKPPVAGLLGAEILRSHHGIIDFGTRTLYLRK